MENQLDILSGYWVIDLEGTIERLKDHDPEANSEYISEIRNSLEGLTYEFRKDEFRFLRKDEEEISRYLGYELEGQNIKIKIQYDELDEVEIWDMDYLEEKLHFNDFWVMRRLHEDEPIPVKQEPYLP